MIILRETDLPRITVALLDYSAVGLLGSNKELTVSTDEGTIECQFTRLGAKDTAAETIAGIKQVEAETIVGYFSLLENLRTQSNGIELDAISTTVPIADATDLEAASEVLAHCFLFRLNWTQLILIENRCHFFDFFFDFKMIDLGDHYCCFYCYCLYGCFDHFCFDFTDLIYGLYVCFRDLDHHCSFQSSCFNSFQTADLFCPRPLLSAHSQLLYHCNHLIVREVQIHQHCLSPALMVSQKCKTGAYMERLFQKASS